MKASADKAPNNRLRAARLRRPTPSGFGGPMSPQELAEAVNGYLWERYGSGAPTIDARKVREHESGRYRWPTALVREGYRAVLGAACDADLGFYGGRTPPCDHDPGAGSTLIRPYTVPAYCTPGLDTASANDHQEMLSALRRCLLAPGRSPRSAGEPDHHAQRADIGAAHLAYQRADYSTTASLLPDIIGRAEAGLGGGRQRQAAEYLLPAAHLAAAKLALRAGDHSLALVAADRARRGADSTGNNDLAGAAAHSIACAVLATPQRQDQAADLVAEALDVLDRDGLRTRARLSVRGALTLLSGVIAARRGRHQDAACYLDRAASMADQIGGDHNDVWTGFGPTNVAIHRIGIAADYDPAAALRLGASVDLSRLPEALIGRRTRVHLDLAAAHARGAGHDASAVLHLLEAERLSAQIFSVNQPARHLIAELLQRERHADMPGLRALAERTAVAA
ncbi:hypothetical protein GCM10010123_01610 [Pilimelia anulata]|uniref:Uncharacterized protein n=1 Tax=Pilimelia anulata TaxID=53371 RepID=A0A8J3AZN8_9ACTN|nr:hypothetical protein [Pilimelia anulata]GGJ75292.1 hypothetical protein GCM10010123_01610 [Pilimelia anulata]